MRETSTICQQFLIISSQCPVSAFAQVLTCGFYCGVHVISIMFTLMIQTSFVYLSKFLYSILWLLLGVELKQSWISHSSYITLHWKSGIYTLR